MPQQQAHVPLATYRLQLGAGFTFQDAARLVEPLHELGVDCLYLSPILKARPGSPHGYDVVDPSCLNPELGTEKDLEDLVLALAARGMGILLDIVPNHMGVGDDSNPRWNDVLAHGPSSRFAPWFDIDWEDPDPELRGKVLLPILEADLPEVLDRGEVRVETEGGVAVLRAGGRTLPLEPSTRPPPLEAQRFAGPESRALLEDLLSRQHYVLASWREASRRLNYRRFFDIHELAGVRVEDPEVFQDTHRLVLDLVSRGWVQGLRVDHPDGLRDPARYFQDLRAACGEDTWIVAEKILEHDEALREDWPVHGTTGYEFLNDLGGVMLHAEGARALRAFYARFTGDQRPFEDVLHGSKRHVLRTSLQAELARAVRALRGIASRDPVGSGLHPEDLEEAVVELAACFPVYRTYLQEAPAPLHAEDRRRIRQALDEAGRRNPPLARSALPFLASVLLCEAAAGGPEDDVRLRREWALRFQQLTAPATAKGMEDTALYRQVFLGSLNEVGGDPRRTGLSIQEFHRRMVERQRRHPHALNTTSTHDTKRSEDVRARIANLAEIPRLWAAAVGIWANMNGPFLRSIPGRAGPVPDPAEEHLVYQTIPGMWPRQRPTEEERTHLRERLEQYMVKALREARIHTSWTDPDTAYEEAVRSFLRDILQPPHPFAGDIREFTGLVARAAAMTSAIQALLKVLLPGVPDLYQGTELPEFSLVDPDNRRPVDFAARRAALAALPREGDLEGLRGLLADPLDGRAKLLLLHRALRLRREHPALFQQGEYLPLETTGAGHGQVLAFARRLGGQAVLVLAGRCLLSPDRITRDPPAKAWTDTAMLLPTDLPAGPFTERITGRTVPARSAAGGRGRVLLREAFAFFPAAILDMEPQGGKNVRAP